MYLNNKILSKNSYEVNRKFTSRARRNVQKKVRGQTTKKNPTEKV